MAGKYFVGYCSYVDLHTIIAIVSVALTVWKLVKNAMFHPLS